MNSMTMELYGNFRTRKFSDIFPDEETFAEEMAATPFDGFISDTSLNLLYYLLYSQYGNSHIANSDENQFEYRMFATIFQFGPTWEKRLEIQKSIRELTLDQIKDGGKAIYNHANHPGQAPTTSSLNELAYIDDQNTTNYKKSDLEAYNLLWNMLDTDVTKDFIAKFRNLFLTIVEPELPLWYSSDEDNEGAQ